MVAVPDAAYPTLFPVVPRHVRVTVRILSNSDYIAHLNGPRHDREPSVALGELLRSPVRFGQRRPHQQLGREGGRDLGLLRVVVVQVVDVVEDAVDQGDYDSVDVVPCLTKLTLCPITASSAEVHVALSHEMSLMWSAWLCTSSAS